MSDFRIIQGNTGPSLEVQNAMMTSVDGWECRMELLSPAGAKVIDRAVTDVNLGGDRFIARLTATDTASLTPDTYNWRLILENTSITPAFESFEVHTIEIEPKSTPRGNLELARGENSFCDYQALLEQLEAMPELSGAHGVSRVRLKAAAVEAWYDIGALCVDLGNGLSTSRYLSATLFDSLPASHQAALIRAQLLQADFIITTPETVRDGKVRTTGIGESVMVFRNNRRVIVCDKAVESLRPFIVPGWQHTARLCP